MQGRLRLVLEAHSAELNHHRRYELEIGKNLFGSWTLTVRHGRCGSRCQETIFTDDSPVELQRVALDRLRRRRSAMRRIGCDYTIVETFGGSESTWRDWFPKTLLSEFASEDELAYEIAC
ncbi:WGR domain-containing protein [Roseiconus lacunae]|uniref:WGR domain-containing protein n=1 Tax=Roseiconus lacunae TaxID=2605694 RepID=UPI0036F42488